MRIRNNFIRRTLFIFSLPIILPIMFAYALVDMLKLFAYDLIDYSKYMWFNQDNEFED